MKYCMMMALAAILLLLVGCMLASDTEAGLVHTHQAMLQGEDMSYTYWMDDVCPTYEQVVRVTCQDTLYTAALVVLLVVMVCVGTWYVRDAQGR